MIPGTSCAATSNKAAGTRRHIARTRLRADLAIYQAGLDLRNASFETTTPTWEAFNAAKLSRHRHVATDTTPGHVLPSPAQRR